MFFLFSGSVGMCFCIYVCVVLSILGIERRLLLLFLVYWFECLIPYLKVVCAGLGGGMLNSGGCWAHDWQQEFFFLYTT